jgi:hypothetical protein
LRGVAWRSGLRLRLRTLRDDWSFVNVEYGTVVLIEMDLYLCKVKFLVRVLLRGSSHAQFPIVFNCEMMRIQQQSLTYPILLSFQIRPIYQSPRIGRKEFSGGWRLFSPEQWKQLIRRQLNFRAHLLSNLANYHQRLFSPTWPSSAWGIKLNI